MSWIVTGLMLVPALCSSAMAQRPEPPAVAASPTNVSPSATVPASRPASSAKVGSGAPSGSPLGQRASQPISPLDPGDLTKPAFDTQTPVYNLLPTPDTMATTVVAEVEGSVITLGDVREAIAALPAPSQQAAFENLYPVVLDKLIQEQGLAVRARQQGLDQDPEYKRKMRALASEELANRYLRLGIENQITEAMLLARYARDIQSKPGETEIRARIILTGAEDQAKTLIEKIKTGEDFAMLARQVSKDVTGRDGGDLGYLPADRLAPQIAGVLSGLTAGQIAPVPVQGPGGWYVLRLEGRRQAPRPGFAEVHDRLEETLMREAVPSFTQNALKGLTIRRFSFNGSHETTDTEGAK